MKVHITLVGGQPAPVYHGIVAVKPDKVVYVYSNSKDSLRALEMLRKEVHLPEDEYPELDTTNPVEIARRAEELAERYKDDEVTLNISSGLKSWSHLFGRVFDGMPDAAVVYMDQNNVLWNYRIMKSQTDFVFDMDALFRLYGNPLRHYTAFDDYTHEDAIAAEKIERIRKYQVRQFNDLLTVIPKAWTHTLNAQSEGRFDISRDVYVEWEKPGFVRISLAQVHRGPRMVEITSPHAVSLAFNSGWFEFRAARMLSHWEYGKDIRMNCIFPESNKPNMTQFPKNEIDIIVNTGTKLLFVECKTKINSSTDIDKFRTAVRNYGGIGSKALFVTDIPMTELQKEKCRESGIISFALSDPAISQDREQALFAILNKELYNINA